MKYLDKNGVISLIQQLRDTTIGNGSNGTSSGSSDSYGFTDYTRGSKDIPIQYWNGSATTTSYSTYYIVSKSLNTKILKQSPGASDIENLWDTLDDGEFIFLPTTSAEFAGTRELIDIRISNFFLPAGSLICKQNGIVFNIINKHSITAYND